MAEINNSYKLGNRTKEVYFNEAKFDIKAFSGDSRKISGYAAVFNNKDSADDILIKGCFAKSINEAGPTSSNYRKIAFLNQHNQTQPIGKITELKEDEFGLYFEAEISKTQLGDEVLEQIKDGTLNQFSIGFRYIMDKCSYDNEKEAFIVKEVMLFEISVVTLGCNPLTHFTGFKSANDYEAEQLSVSKQMNEFERLLTNEQKQLFNNLIQKNIALAIGEPRKHSNENEPQIDVNQFLSQLNQTTLLK